MASMCLLCGNVPPGRRGVGREIGDSGSGRFQRRATARDPVEEDARSDLQAGGSRGIRRPAAILSSLLTDPLPVTSPGAATVPPQEQSPGSDEATASTRA
jgi:hypothetical protein